MIALDHRQLYLELLIFHANLAWILHQWVFSVDQNIYHIDVW